MMDASCVTLTLGDSGGLPYLADETLRKELLRFGADPLEAGFAEFLKRIRSRKSRIKALLLDQQVLRGVGNIYADESLWKAKIHPAKLGMNLSEGQIKKLYQSLQAILREAIVMRGSSISDFLDADGEPGNISYTIGSMDEKARNASLQNGDPAGDCGGAEQFLLRSLPEAAARLEKRNRSKAEEVKTQEHSQE